MKLPNFAQGNHKKKATKRIPKEVLELEKEK